MIKILRFIGAVVLAIITSIAIHYLAVVLYGGTVFLIRDFSFLNFVLYSLLLSMGHLILRSVVPLLMGGFILTVQGSKVTAIIVILIFVYYFGGSCIQLLGDSDSALMIAEAAGAFYQAGAILTLIIEFICYGVISLLLFINPNKYW